MAIISIPSSIGGVTLPGLTNVPGGPLGVLFGSANQVANYQYPRDLGSNTKGHVVRFTINQIEPVNYSESAAIQGLTSAWTSITQGNYAGAASSAFNGLTEQASQLGSTFSNAGNKIGEGGSLKDAYDLLLDNRKKKAVSTIDLYMPDTVNFQYNVGFSKTSLVNSLVQGVGLLGTPGKAVASMSNDVLNSDLTKLTLQTQGLAINPQEQLLFDGIDFRTYQLAFTFTPYSRQEAKSVANIIQQFRQYAAPQIKKGAGGMFFIPPGTFNLEFLLNGKRNPNVTRVEESVITSIDVNYAPNGWSAHPDGAPVQTTLTLNFQEIRLIDKTKIIQGY
jgi:hypothetical protein